MAGIPSDTARAWGRAARIAGAGAPPNLRVPRFAQQAMPYAMWADVSKLPAIACGERIRRAVSQRGLVASGS